MTKVLLIDDDINELNSLEKALNNEGYQVFTAAGGRAGLDIVQKQIPDLVILDLIMRGTNGFETSYRLYELGVQSVLIIGPRNERHVIESLETGADDYLSKPIAIPILLAKVRMLLRRNSSEPFSSRGMNDLFLVIHYIWVKGQKYRKKATYSSLVQNSPTDRSCTLLKSPACDGGQLMIMLSGTVCSISRQE